MSVRGMRLLSALAATAVVLSGCSSPDQPVEPPPAEPPRVEPPPPPEPPAEPPEPRAPGQPELVEPRPGMVDAQPRPWDEAFVLDQGRTVELRWWSGVEPCHVLDRVEVEPGEQVITLTILEGRDPEAGDEACPDLGVYKAVRVPLDEPVGQRSLADGAEL